MKENLIGWLSAIVIEIATTLVNWNSIRLLPYSFVDLGQSQAVEDPVLRSLTELLAGFATPNYGLESPLACCLG